MSSTIRYDQATACRAGTASVSTELTNFWFRIIDPKRIGPENAIAEEIAGFTNESVEEVLRKMATGKDDLKHLWVAQSINPTDSESVSSFYRDQFIEAYELADWHCGRTNGVPPLNYARAALFAQREGLRRALDFGSGIGSGSLALASVGCEVHSADIARELLQLVGYRMRQRGHQSQLIDLNSSERPRRGYYDLITCFDVLEHIPDQAAKLLELQSYLRVGGYLLVNLMNESYHESRPMHISSAGNWLALIRRTSMSPVWSEFVDDLQVLVRTRFSWLRNRVAAIRERYQRS